MNGKTVYGSRLFGQTRLSVRLGILGLQKKAEAGRQQPASDLGMPESIERAVDITLQNSYRNPRALDADGISRLLLDAWSGSRPTS